MTSAETQETKRLEALSHHDLIAYIITLSRNNAELKKKIATLEKDSTTSSKPPSSDQFPKNKNQSLRTKTGKKSGGQTGQHRKGIIQTATPDTIIPCAVSHCTACGTTLTDIHGQIHMKRQERDIPPITVSVTEYQQIAKTCPCGHQNVGAFPNHITAPIQIGTNASAFMVYLNIAHLLPYKRLTTLAHDLFGFPISEGSIDNILEKAGRHAVPLQQVILHMIQKERWVGSDETGMRVHTKTHWLWVWQNLKGAYYAIDKGRGYAVVEKHFGEDYMGALVHDCWSAQNNTKSQRGHQQCHPHIQRALAFLIQEYRLKWAHDLTTLLSASHKARDTIWQDDFNTRVRTQVIQYYEDALEQLLQTPLVEKEALTLQKRIRKHKDAILFFMHDADTPFHNNDSEKAIRQAKVKQKVSGCFRSNNGAERYASLLSVVETSKKQGKNVLDSIVQLLEGSLVFEGC